MIALDRGELPWPPLVAGGEGLNRHPAPPVALRARMAAVYGVAPECVLPVAGADHGAALVRAAFGEAVAIIDERAIEFSEMPSRAAEAAADPALAVLRDLGPYGLAGAPVGAVIAHPSRIAALVCAPPLATPVVKLAEAVLAPERALATAARWAELRHEGARLATALGLPVTEANRIVLETADPAAFKRLGLAVEWLGPTTARATIGTPAQNDLILAAMGHAPPQRLATRAATVTRDTKETKIVASVDLDRAGPVHVATGIGYYDHMLEQVATHGGFALTLQVEGDLHIDPHHTVEDSALALGEALKQALGDRAGIARFGFTAPMDEAEGRVSLDLSGRPFSVFTGAFHAAHIGQYPTALTSHVFRSLAQAMRAAIHVHVTGEDDHHKTEVAFKAFGRALRQAIRLEGDAIPSTKGVL